MKFCTTTAPRVLSLVVCPSLQSQLQLAESAYSGENSFQFTWIFEGKKTSYVWGNFLMRTLYLRSAIVASFTVNIAFTDVTFAQFTVPTRKQNWRTLMLMFILITRTLRYSHWCWIGRTINCLRTTLVYPIQQRRSQSKWFEHWRNSAFWWRWTVQVSIVLRKTVGDWRFDGLRGGHLETLHQHVPLANGSYTDDSSGYLTWWDSRPWHYTSRHNYHPVQKITFTQPSESVYSSLARSANRRSHDFRVRVQPRLRKFFWVSTLRAFSLSDHVIIIIGYF